jgi:hypothetical protein
MTVERSCPVASEQNALRPAIPSATPADHYNGFSRKSSSERNTGVRGMRAIRVSVEEFEKRCKRRIHKEAGERRKRLLTRAKALL